MSAESDPDPFVVLSIRRAPGSADATATASCYWGEDEAHRAATALPKDDQRVWLLTPGDPDMDRCAYVEETTDAS